MRGRAEGVRRRGPTPELRELARVLERSLPTLAAWAHGRLPRRARWRFETLDLVQEAAVGALLHLDEDDAAHPEQVENYLRQSIRHRIVDEIRRAAYVEIGTEEAAPEVRDREPLPLEGAIAAQERRRFRAALHRLDEDEQMLVVGRIDLELSYAELALATGRPSPDAARVATRRALDRLTTEIARAGAPE